MLLALRPRLAVDARPHRQSLVSDGTAVPAARRRAIGRDRCAEVVTPRCGLLVSATLLEVYAAQKLGERGARRGIVEDAAPAPRGCAPSMRCATQRRSTSRATIRT